MRRSRTRRFKVAAALGGLVLALLVAEVGLRLVEARPDPSKGVKVHPVAADSLANPLGLRDRWDALPQDPDSLRIAFLGDSFTYGLGVDAKDTFVRRVGERLKGRFPRWCVTVNLGRPGVDLITAWVILNQVRDRVRPQVVVHVLSQDDLDVDLYKEGHAVERLVTERSWPSRYSRLSDRIETSIRWSMASPRIVDNLRGGATPEQRERAWRIASYQIEAIKRLVEEAGGVYALVRFPCLRWVGPDRTYPLGETHRRTADLAARLGVPYLDLSDAFRDQDPAEMCLSVRDDHPTPPGHQIAGDAIAEFLLRDVLGKVRAGPTSRPTTVRSARDILAAEIRQYERILELDPTCASARFWLERARGSHPPMDNRGVR